jgi:alcohol dehydrogenase
MIVAGELSPERLIGKTIDIEESISVLTSMNDFTNTGVTIITKF